ncbi:MAG: NAD(P)H-binding protein [Mycobacterium sp.]
MNSPQVQCLVTGSTGYIGGRLIPALLERGHKVRAMARTPEKLDDVPWRSDVEVVQADLSDPDSLKSACVGVDVVFYLAHSMGTSDDFVAEEKKTAENVVAAAREAGVRRLVYLSGLHPAGVELSKHLESRTAVGDVLIESGIETVVLQAGVVIGSGSASFEMIRHLTEVLPVMTTPKWVHNKIQPIALRDVLYYLAESATATVPESRTWDIGGPDVLEYGDMMQNYAMAAGLRQRLIVVLPFLTPTIASWWVGLVTPIPPGLARPLVESLECDAVADEHDIDAVIPPPPGGGTRYTESLRLALDHVDNAKFESTWSQPTPASPLPSDPPWAGELTFTADDECTITHSPEAVWEAISHPGNRWRIVTSTPKSAVRLLAQGRIPGELWLDIEISPAAGGGTAYRHTATLCPHGLPGRLYAISAWQAHRKLLRRIMLRRLGR